MSKVIRLDDETMSILTTFRNKKGSPYNVMSESQIVKAALMDALSELENIDIAIKKE